MNICKIENCNNPIRCLGVCNKHYHQIKFKEAVKALPINIEMLTKGKLNDTTHIKRANAA